MDFERRGANADSKRSTNRLDANSGVQGIALSERESADASVPLDPHGAGAHSADRATPLTEDLTRSHSSATSNHCLAVDGLSVRFGAINAIGDVSLVLRPKTITGLIGPNGAGKTTLVNCLTGFLRPTSGSILFDGKSTAGWRPDQFRRAGISRSFQSVRLFSGLSVVENVEVAGVALGLNRRAARSMALEALDFMGIRDLADLEVSSLPYVTERLVGLARAVVGRPRYLLLDEPAAGMSETEAEALLELLHKMVSTFGSAILLIEHNMELVMQACSRILVLDGGRALVEGTPDAIRTNEDVVRAYLGGE